MMRFSHSAGRLLLIGFLGSAAGSAIAQTVFTGTEHVLFDSPEGWALKYFTSASMLSGLQPPEPQGEHTQLGSINFGFETGWLPELNQTRASVGFSGSKQEDVNKAPVFMRPVLRVGLPWRLTAVVAGLPPAQVFGVTPRLFALGVERPVIERYRWTLGWRASGQVGSVQAAFTCPQKALGFPPGSPGNPTSCVGTSADEATLRYIGTEIQAAYRAPFIPRVTPHVALGYNYVNSVFQIDAPLVKGIDHTRLWTSGNVVTGTAGASVLLTKRMAFTVDAFYAPLFIRRNATGGRANDGLFNVRALISYTVR